MSGKPRTARPLPLTPEYHGADLDDAHERARIGGGVVIFSAAPGTNSGPTAQQSGYWSDSADAMEREVWTAARGGSLSALKRSEARFTQGGAR